MPSNIDRERTWHPPLPKDLTPKEEVVHAAQWYAKTSCVQKDQYAFVLRLGVEQKEEFKEGAAGFTVAQVSDNVSDLGLTVDDVLNHTVDTFLSQEDAQAVAHAVHKLKEINTATHDFTTWEKIAEELLQKKVVPTPEEKEMNQTQNSLLRFEGGESPPREGLRTRFLVEKAFQRWRRVRISVNGIECWGTLCLTQNKIIQILCLEKCTGEEEQADAALPSLIHGIMKITETLARSEDHLEALHEVSCLVRDAVDADRVMIYKFKEDGHGEVTAEALSDKRGPHDAYLGLCFPASDIPLFARLLFSKVPYRLIPRVEVDTPYSNLIPSTVNINGCELNTDISECAGRWIAGIHLQYLRNMHVTGSFVLPLFCGTRLWGLISAQTVTMPLKPSYHVREACTLIALLVSVDLSRRAREDSAHRKLLTHSLMVSHMNLSQQGAQDLLSSLNCDCVALVEHMYLKPSNKKKQKKSVETSVKVPVYEKFTAKSTLTSSETTVSKLECGTVDVGGESEKSSEDTRSSRVLQYYGRVQVHEEQLASIAEAIRECHAKSAQYQPNENGVLLTAELGQWLHDPELLDNPCQPSYQWAGLALLSVSHYSVIMLRPECTRMIKWAGKELKFKEGEPLTPRNSFEEWTELHKGGSQLWTNEDLEFLRGWCSILVELDKFNRINTEHQEMINAQLRESRDLAVLAANQKAAFLRHMSHELRTPFNGMIGMMSLLLRTSLDPDQLELALTSFRCAADMLDILDDVLLVSKLESNKVEVRSQSFDLPSLLESAYKLTGVRAAQLGVLMRLEITGAYAEELKLDTKMNNQTIRAKVSAWRRAVPPKYRIVKGDPGRIRQVLLNLLGNAVKFTTGGQEVCLRVVRFENLSDIKRYTDELNRKYEGCSVATDLSKHLSKVVHCATPYPSPTHSASHAGSHTGTFTGTSSPKSEVSDKSKHDTAAKEVAPPIVVMTSTHTEEQCEYAPEKEAECSYTNIPAEESTGIATTVYEEKKTLISTAESTGTCAPGYTYPEGDVAYYALSVVDTGCGIEADRIDFLFKPFNQLDNTPSRSYEGTGLGLTISKDLVSLMGGELILHSTANEGSCFTAFLALPYGNMSKVKDTESPTTEDTAFSTSTLDVLQEQQSADMPLQTELSVSEIGSWVSKSIQDQSQEMSTASHEYTHEGTGGGGPLTVNPDTIAGVRGFRSTVEIYPLFESGSQVETLTSVPPTIHEGQIECLPVPPQPIHTYTKSSHVVPTDVCIEKPEERHMYTYAYEKKSADLEHDMKRDERQASVDTLPPTPPVGERKTTGPAPIYSVPEEKTSSFGESTFEYAVELVNDKLKNGKKSVLIVDDNKINRMVLQKMVKNVSSSLVVLTATNGAQAISEVRKHHNDIALVLMDLFMPEVDGWEATAAIRDMEKEAQEMNDAEPGASDIIGHVPVIALTADVMADQHTLITYGFDSLLTKPILSIRINKILAGAAHIGE